MTPLTGSLALLAALAAVTPSGVGGTYRMQGKAHVSASGLIDEDAELRADALLAPGAGPRDVRVRVAAQGHTCDLLARMDGEGALVLNPGQRCPVALDTEKARGKIDLVVKTGKGQVRGDHLSLALTCDVTGSLQFRTGGMSVFGMDVPETWLPAVPVSGDVTASAEGDRGRAKP